MAWDCAEPVDSDDVVHTAHFANSLSATLAGITDPKKCGEQIWRSAGQLLGVWHPAILVRRQPVLDDLCHIVERGALTQLVRSLARSE